MCLCSPAKSEVTRRCPTVKTHVEWHHKALWRKRMRARGPAGPAPDHMTLGKSLHFSEPQSTSLSNASDDDTPRAAVGVQSQVGCGLLSLEISHQCLLWRMAFLPGSSFPKPTRDPLQPLSNLHSNLYPHISRFFCLVSSLNCARYISCLSSP